MFFSKKKEKTILYLIIGLISFNVYSNNDIQITHSVLSHEQLDKLNAVNLHLIIDNNSPISYHNLKISPSGNEYALDNKNNSMTVGNLPAMGQAVIQLTTSTPRALVYFQSGLPIFFHITAKTENGHFIEIPVYSNMGALE